MKILKLLVALLITATNLVAFALPPIEWKLFRSNNKLSMYVDPEPWALGNDEVIIYVLVDHKKADRRGDISDLAFINIDCIKNLARINSQSSFSQHMAKGDPLPTPLDLSTKMSPIIPSSPIGELAAKYCKLAHKKK